LYIAVADLCVFFFDLLVLFIQWLEDLTASAKAAEQQQQDEQQQQRGQYAYAALRRLLVNDPCIAAASAGNPPEHTVKLLQAAREVWQACRALPPGQTPLQQLRRLWVLLRVLLRLDPHDIRVTRFLVHCKVGMLSVFVRMALPALASGFFWVLPCGTACTRGAAHCCKSPRCSLFCLACGPAGICASF
jgi:hypothetical protein